MYYYYYIYIYIYPTAHRLMAHVSATAPEKADSLMEALFHAYFEQVGDAWLL